METHDPFVRLNRQNRFNEHGFAAQLVLWSARMWLRAYYNSTKSHITSIAVLAIGTYRNVLFLRLEEQYVSDDEWEFLEVLEAFQWDRLDEAHTKLDVWLPLSGTFISSSAFVELAQSLGDCGLVIRLEQQATPTGQVPKMLPTYPTRI